MARLIDPCALQQRWPFGNGEDRNRVGVAHLDPLVGQRWSAGSWGTGGGNRIRRKGAAAGCSPWSGSFGAARGV